MYGKLWVILLGILCFALPLEVKAEMTFQFGEVELNERLDLHPNLYYENLVLRHSETRVQRVHHAVMGADATDLEMVLFDIYPDIGQFASATVLVIAMEFERMTGRKVYAAVNGDFFWNHAPIDYYVKEGIVWNEGYHPEKASFGFNREGDFAIGRPTTGIMIRLDGQLDLTFPVAKLDGQLPYPGEIGISHPGRAMPTIHTSKYLVKATTETIVRGFNMPLEGTLFRPDDMPMLTSESVTTPAGFFGVAVNGMSGQTALAEQFYAAANHGMDVLVTHTTTGPFAGLDYVIGGNNILVKNAIAMPFPLRTSSAGESWAPRTTVGVLQNGSFFVTVMDGRAPGFSNGLTVPQQAQLALDFGAHTALELDGGGSSTFVLRVDDQLQIVNHPSDGTPRRVTNAVLMVEAEERIQDETLPIDDDQGDTNPKGGCAGLAFSWSVSGQSTRWLLPVAIMQSLVVVVLISITKRRSG